MTPTAVRWLMAMTVAAVAIVPLNAKGSTVKLIVSGASLPRPLELTDNGLLDASNVYEGSFIGPAVSPQEIEPRRYTVSFHVDAPAWMKEPVRVRYVVLYVKDEIGGGGFVYLPGRGEHGYAVNVGTIQRKSDDGQWHRAREPWASALNRYLP